MEFPKDYKSGVSVIYLTVDEKGATLNVFATLGAAIDAVKYDSRRIREDLIDELTPTKCKWHDIQGDPHSLEVKVCPVCTDFALDYMNHPRALEL